MSLALLWYALDARKWFKGPKINVEQCSQWVGRLPRILDFLSYWVGQFPDFHWTFKKQVGQF
jgi:hypothetical protein